MLKESDADDSDTASIASTEPLAPSSSQQIPPPQAYAIPGPSPHHLPAQYPQPPYQNPPPNQYTQFSPYPPQHSAKGAPANRPQENVAVYGGYQQASAGITSFDRLLEPAGNPMYPPLVWNEITPQKREEGLGDLRYYKVISVNNHVLFIGGLSDEYNASRGYDIIPTLTITKKGANGSSSSRWHFRKATGTIPPPRYGHSLTRVGNKVFLFGGRDTGSTTTFNDFYYLDLDLMVWSKIAAPETQDPLPRYNHTCTYLNKRLFFIGGINSNVSPPQYKSHVGVFDLEAWAWEDSGSSSQQPSIAGHVAIPFNNPNLPSESYILVFGGNSHLIDFSKPDYAHHSQHDTLSKAQFYKIDRKTWETKQLGVSIDPTIHHAVSWRALRDGSLQVFINGGFRDGSQQPNNMLVLRLDKEGLVWRQRQQIIFKEVETPELRHHCMAIVEGELYLFGGLKDLGRQPSPIWCCFNCVDVFSNTSVFRITLPVED